MATLKEFIRQSSHQQYGFHNKWNAIFYDRKDDATWGYAIYAQLPKVKLINLMYAWIVKGKELPEYVLHNEKYYPVIAYATEGNVPEFISKVNRFKIPISLPF